MEAKREAPWSPMNAKKGTCGTLLEPNKIAFMAARESESAWQQRKAKQIAL